MRVISAYWKHLTSRVYASAEAAAAAADPALADRQRRLNPPQPWFGFDADPDSGASRKGGSPSDGAGGGTLLIIDHTHPDLTLDTYFDDSETVSAYFPTWYKVHETVQTHFYRNKGRFKKAKRLVKQYRQRAQRGWSDSDVWSLDIFLAETIRDTVRQLRDTTMSTPLHMTQDEWHTTLTTIADGFDAHLTIVNTAPDDDRYLRDLRAKGFNALRDNFSGLWD